MSDPTYNYGSYGGNNEALFMGNDMFAETLDPLGIWHKNPTAYATVTTPGSSKYTKEQQELLQRIIGGLSGYNIGNTPTYTGQLNTMGNAVYGNTIQDYLSKVNPNSPLYQAKNQTLMDLIQGKTGMPAALEANFKANVEDPMLKNYKETIMPSLAHTYASKGLSYGTPKQEAVQAEAQTLMDALSKGRAQLGADITKSTLDAQISGLDKSLADIIGTSQTGVSLNTMEQNALDTKYKEWLRTQPGGSSIDQYIMQLLGLTPNYQSSTQVLGGGGGDASGGGGIVGMIGSLFG